MPDRMPLVDLPVGSTFRLTGRLDTIGPGGASTTFLREDGESVGTLTINADGSGTLDMTIPLTEAMVEPLAIAMEVGDVMQNLDTGETVIVMAAGLGPDGRQFSPSRNHRPSYDPERWVKVGHVDPDNL